MRRCPVEVGLAASRSLTRRRSSASIVNGFVEASEKKRTTYWPSPMLRSGRRSDRAGSPGANGHILRSYFQSHVLFGSNIRTILTNGKGRERRYKIVLQVVRT